ncbi:MAG TPA: J domain-containing protein [Polyangiaceae bacterium]
MSSPPPTATGNLGSTPLVNLVVYALDHQLTGTLVLEEPDRRKHAVYFDSGAASKVRLATNQLTLGEVLVDLALLPEADREETYQSARLAEQLHGQALVAQGTLADQQLRDALREQTARKLLLLSELLPSDTIFGYFDRLNFLERWGGVEVVRGKPLAIIWRLVAARADRNHLARVLERLAESPLKLHREAPLLRFHFDHTEQTVIDVLRAKPQPISELLARDLAERALVERLVYALAITRQLDLDVPGAEPLGADEAPSSSRIPLQSFTPPGGFAFQPAGGSIPPRGSVAPIAESPAVTALKAEIRERAARTDEPLYDVLGVPRDAPVTAIQSAYLALAKRLHPDRLGAEYQDVRELATRVFARISEAHQVLTDTQQRREYNLKLRKAGAEANEAEHVQRVLRAATSFQKAEVLMKRNNLAQAEVHARQALAEDPDQADHIALVAWIESQKPEPDLRALIKDLDRSITIQPNNLRAHWYRGQLYKRIGKDARAIQDFRFIVERDPRHTDAVRELRLYQMRRGSSTFSSYPPGNPSTRPSPMPPSGDKAKSDSGASGSGSGSGGGLISKLFKR